MMINKKKSGLAIIVVIGIATILAIVGGAYLKAFVDSTPSQIISLDRVQADYFARGIQNIALFKIKYYPDYFIRAYRMDKYKERFDNNEVTQAFLSTFPNPSPFTSFLTDGAMYGEGGMLINSDVEGFKDPLTCIASYSTDIKLNSALDFDRNLIEITVYVNTVTRKRDMTTPYKISVDAQQVINNAVAAPAP